MDNIKKAIMFAVGILFTIGIIAWGVTFYVKAGNMTRQADGSLNEVAQTIDKNRFTQYNDTTVNGTDVINAIRMYATKNFTVVVKTKENTSGEDYNEAKYNITDISDSDYIEPTAQFESDLDTSTNDTVNKITFTQVGSSTSN